MINKNLENKVVAITGAGGVLCGEFAKECVKQKMKIALLDLNEEEINKRALEYKKAGVEVLPIKCNILDLNSIQTACDEIIKTFGKVDILINGAGGNNPEAQTTNEYYSENDVQNENVKSFFDMTEQGFKFVFDLNFLGTFNVCQTFAKHMLKPGCSIINISSASAPHSLTKVPAYSAAKAAIENFTQWMAIHFANTGLRCNAMAPGFFLTNQNYNLLMKDGKPTSRTEKILKATPMNKLGDPSDLLGGLIYLMDDKMSGFVTGQTIVIDGGFLAYVGV